MGSWLSQAAGLYNAGRPELAEKLLEKALVAGHDSPQLRALRCRCLTVRQRFREAEEDALKALEFDPEYAEAYNALAWCHYRARRIEKAYQAADEAMRLDPNESRHHHLRGVLRYGRGKLAEALTCLEEALRLDPENTEAARLKAQILMARGHTQRALETARDALSREPEDPALLETMAWAHLDKCDPALAERAFRAALQKDPTNLSAQEGLRAASERLYSWKVGAGMGAMAAALAGLGWKGTLPDGMLAAVVIGIVGTLASFLGLLRREKLRGAAGCLLLGAGIVSLSLFFLLAIVISRLESMPSEQWRGASLLSSLSALASAGIAAAIEIRGRRA